MAFAISSTVGAAAFASDHDDGITNIKTRNRNITDIYAFREDNQTGRSTDGGNLVFIMNSNPRAIGGRQEYFDPRAVYDLNFTKLAAASKNNTPTGSQDLVLRLRFGQPDRYRHQNIKLSAVKNGMDVAAEPEITDQAALYAITTNLAEAKSGRSYLNRFRFQNGARVDVFAGLREASAAVDFTVGYNVNTIVMRIPLAMLETPVLDIWGTISVNGKQVERLARPAINEGLIITNSFLNAFDRIDGKIDIPAAKVVAEFLPDVMRIDTRVNIPVGTTAYNADLSGDKGILTGGCKLEDDVMDITLSLLVAGDATGQAVKDNVSYAGAAGNRNQGHKLLSGQTTRLGPAFFPFLSRPN